MNLITNHTPALSFKLYEILKQLLHYPLRISSSYYILQGNPRTQDDYDIALGGDLMQLVDGDDDSFFDDYHSDSIDSATVLPGTSNETLVRL